MTEMIEPARRPGRDGLALLLVLLLAGIALLFTNPVVDVAQKYNREVAVSAVAIYASVRGATSVMSVARDADFQAGAVVGSVTASPGQVLQPVIATLERMADLLFALAIVSGILAVSLPVVGTLGALTLATGAGLAVVLRFWRVPLWGLRRTAGALVFVGLVGAAILPGAYLVAFVVGDRVTAEAWNRAGDVFRAQASGVEAAAGQIATPPPVAAPTDEAAGEGDMFSWFGEAMTSTGAAIGGALSGAQQFAGWVGTQVAANAQVISDGVASAGALFEASVDIGVAYLVKLVVLPGLIVFAALWVLRAAMRPGPIETIRSIEAPPA